MTPRPDSRGGLKPRLLVADSSATSRAGVRAAIATHGYAIAAEAADARGALEAAARERPDLSLVSLSLPGGGVGLIEMLAEMVPRTRIVALADEETEEDAVAALAAGATGFLARPGALERLPGVLDAALEGRALVGAELMVQLAQRAQRERRDPSWRSRSRTVFSPRERQVLEGLRAGEGTTEIAERLGVSPVTVRRYVSGVLRKAGVPSREAFKRQMLGDREAS